MSAKACQSSNTLKNVSLWNFSKPEPSQPWTGFFQFALASVLQRRDFHPLSGFKNPTVIADTATIPAAVPSMSARPPA
jgi:hypothetical protein